MPAFPPISVPPVTVPPVSVPPGVLPPPPVPPGPVPVLPVTSGHKTTNDACIKRLMKLHLKPAPRVYPPLTKPATIGAEIEIQTNVFGIEIHKQTELFMYSVHIKVDISPLKEVTFTKKGRDDYVVVDRQEKCVAVMCSALEKHDAFFQTLENCIIYDGQSVLFSTRNLFPHHAEVESQSKFLEISGADTGHKDLLNLPCIIMQVFATKNPSVKFSQEDIGRRTSDSNLDSVNHAYSHILELATAQYAIRNTSKCVVFENGKIFFTNPLEEGYHPSDCVEVGDGKRILPGIKKSVHFIEGPYGRGQNNPCVVIDGMKVAFHKEQSVLDKMTETSTGDVSNGLSDFERERCSAVIKGLDCYSTYMGRQRHHKIEGVYHEGAETTKFQMKDGGTMTVFQYFKDRYKIILQYPKVNLVVCKDKGNLNYYPMELMFIAPNQRVKITQQTSFQCQQTTKESAVLPLVRQRLIMTGKSAASISSDNPIMCKLGVVICEEPLLVKARMLPPPKLAISETGTNLFQMRDNKLRISHYTRPAKSLKTWALYAVGSQNTRFTDENLRSFGAHFIQMSKSKGLLLPELGECCLIHASNIEERLLQAAKFNCPFVFVITDDSITNLHQKYKLIERNTKMIVQDLKMSNALNIVQGKMLVLENVIHKTNVKLGGSNYCLFDSKKYLDDNLVIGVGVSAPPPGNRFVLEAQGLLNPTIIGFAHNAINKYEFTGDFLLNATGQETLAPIEDIVTESLNAYKKYHNEATPKRIIVYRSGVGMNVHGNIISYEIPLARAAMENISTGTKLVYIAVTKDHTFRFFRSDLHNLSTPKDEGSSSGSQTTGSLKSYGPPKPSLLNIQPGVSVDTAVTNPACKQFFLNSHLTIQGSAKSPLYSVLADDTNAPMSVLEEMTFNVCHLHQIVGVSTSLPTPLYVAKEYAKRGRNLWLVISNAEHITKGEKPESERLKELTESLGYRSIGLNHRRINA